MDSELERLDQVANWYRATGFEGLMVRGSAAHVVGHVRGSAVLEIGAAEGNVTRELADGERTVVVVEPADEYAAMIEALGLPRVEVVRALAEDFHSATRFDTVVLSHVLEHVDDPEGLLRTAATHLGPGGRVIGVVPNAGSLHRRIGVRMGALTDIHDLTESDLAIGHRRVYDVETFRAAFESAGLTVEHLEGHFCKPLANSQLDALPDATQSALVDVGADLPPELCSEILIVASAG